MTVSVGVFGCGGGIQGKNVDDPGTELLTAGEFRRILGKTNELL